ncbi:MAG: DUF2842 domain-containing protein [Hyphomonadaceae bacterium]|nr:DUF2842 domain-containing protein [Hyphomonadaceae bacterium]
MRQRTRKAIGSLALLTYMGIYALLASTLGALLLPALPFWGELLFFAAAGIVWIFPLKPLFAWMNRP